MIWVARAVCAFVLVFGALTYLTGKLRFDEQSTPADMLARRILTSTGILLMAMALLSWVK